MSKEFNRAEYVRAAKEANVWFNGTVCAVVKDGEVIYRRPQVRKALYIHCGFDVPLKYSDIEEAELSFTETKSQEAKKPETKKSSPSTTERISTLETRIDSIESKLDAILAKLG